MLHPFLPRINIRNGNVEVPVYFLKAKQGYTVGKKNDDWM
jgi:hypothetical protein